MKLVSKVVTGLIVGFFALMAIVYASNMSHASIPVSRSSSLPPVPSRTISSEPVLPLTKLVEECETDFSNSFPDRLTFDFNEGKELLSVKLSVTDDEYWDYYKKYSEDGDVTDWYAFSGTAEDIASHWQKTFSESGYPNAALTLSILRPNGMDTNTVLAQIVRGSVTYDYFDTVSAPALNEASPAKTLGQQNALRSAQSYLSFSSFSWSGLIKQLEFEGYSHDEAVYAANNSDADWFAQAAKSAESYISYTSFSRSGLIEQLEFEGFTHEQAVYGVTKIGY